MFNMRPRSEAPGNIYGNKLTGRGNKLSINLRDLMHGGNEWLSIEIKKESKKKREEGKTKQELACEKD